MIDARLTSPSFMSNIGSSSSLSRARHLLVVADLVGEDPDLLPAADDARVVAVDHHRVLRVAQRIAVVGRQARP